jgi:hypothetical protein
MRNNQVIERGILIRTQNDSFEGPAELSLDPTRTLNPRVTIQ